MLFNHIKIQVKRNTIPARGIQKKLGVFCVELLDLIIMFQELEDSQRQVITLHYTIIKGQ